MLQYCPVLYVWSSGQWREESKHIELPYQTFAEVLEEIKYIRSIFEFLSKPTQYNLPDTYQDMFILVRLADFLGCDVFLDFVSSVNLFVVDVFHALLHLPLGNLKFFILLAVFPLLNAVQQTYMLLVTMT